MSAILSACRTWRYVLTRQVAESGPIGVFILHNPSTADEEQDDPTSRRVVGFARIFGWSRVTIVNPWALRSTDPAALWSARDPVGPTNYHWIRDACDDARASGGFALVGWGQVKCPTGRRDLTRRELHHAWALASDRVKVKCLGTNADGSPKHPLYLKTTAQPIPWQWNG